MSIDGINLATGLVLSIGGAATVLAGAYKVLWHGKKDQHGNRRPGLVKGVFQDLRGFRDAILGREPVLDSITGLEIAPRLPDIGTRMANQEQQMAVLTEAVAAMAQSNRRLDDLDQRVTALEQQKVERVLGKAETIQLLSTMEAVAASESPERKQP